MTSPPKNRNMKRIYTARLKVTSNQGVILNALLAQLCELYNMALQQRRDAYRTCKKIIWYAEQAKELKPLRAEFKEYKQFPSHAQRYCLWQLDKAFLGFFRRIRSGSKAGFPRFRSVSRFDSFSLPENGFRLNGNELKVQKLGTFRIKTKYKIRGRLIKLTIKRNGSKWIALITADIGEKPPKIEVQSSVGVDLGLNPLLTLSNGGTVPNQLFREKEERRLSRAQRDLSNRKEGTKSREQALNRYRRIHQKISGRRLSYLVGVAKDLVGKYDFVAYEKLRIHQMVRSKKAAKVIMNTAWGKLIYRIQCEAEYAGKWAVAVDPRGTTQICSGCGESAEKALKERWHFCRRCGLSIGRDLNAARNILALGVSAAEKQEANKLDGRRDARQGAST